MALLGFLVGNQTALLFEGDRKSMAQIIVIFLVILGIMRLLDIVKQSLLCLIIFFLFFGNYTTLKALKPTPMYLALSSENQQKEYVITCFVEKAEQMDKSVKLTVKNADFYGEREKRLIVFADSFDGIIGDKIEVTGTIADFQTQRNHGEYDSKGHYRTEGIWVCMSGKVKIISHGPFYFKMLADFKDRFAEALDLIAADNTSGTFKAMILGDKSELDTQLSDMFRKNGISHILAISGLHLSIVGLTLYKLLRRMGMGFFVCAAVSIVLLIGYGILTGNSISTVRALIMFIISVNAQVTGRRYDIATSAGLAALLLLIHRPLYVRSCGFLLSFGAVAGIVLIGRAFTNILPESLPCTLRKFLNALMGSVGVSLATIPVLGWFYYEISVYAVLLNLIVIPLMTFVMAGGIIGGLLAMFCKSAGVYVIGLSYYILKLYEIICGFAKQLPNYLMVTGRPDIKQVVVYAVLIIALCIIALKMKKSYKNLLFVTAFCTFAAVLLFYRPDDKLAVHMLDVGQGQCILVENDGKYILVDCGSSDIKNVASKRIIPCLKYYGVSQLDGVFITHLDDDHFNGLNELISQENIRIKRIFYGGMQNDISGVLQCNIPCEKLYAKTSLQWGSTCINFYNPYENISYHDENSASLVFSVEKETVLLLFTGDLDGENEKNVVDLMENIKNYDFRLLQVAHHGSKNSSTAKFLEYVQPDLAIISCGIKNSYGHPHKETLKRFAEVNADVYNTAGYGEITIKPFDKEHVVSCIFP